MSTSFNMIAVWSTLLVALSVVHISNGELVYIRPGHNSSCPGLPCATLDDYSLGNLNLSAFTTLMLTEGTHQLRISTTFSVSNNRNITIAAYNKAPVQISCSQGSGLIFTNVANLVIENIVFDNCGAFFTSPGIILSNVTNSELLNVSILRSSHISLRILENSSLKITNLVVAQNTLPVDSPIANVIIQNSQIFFEGVLNISQNNGLLLDSQGTLTCEPSLRVVILTKTIFNVISSVVHSTANLIVAQNINPTGIVGFWNCSVSWSGDSNLFDNHVCINGALTIARSNFTYTGLLQFDSNSASYYYYPGIASTSSINIIDSFLVVFGVLNFQRNYGDVIGIECFTSTINIYGKLSVVDNNRIYTYSAIILRPGSSLAVNGETILQRNAVYDSVIRMENSRLLLENYTLVESNLGASPLTPRYRTTMTLMGSCLFFNNSGVLFGIDSTINFFGNSQFIRNGVRDLYNEGGIRLYGSFLTMKGNFLFERNNLVGIDGGVIYGLDSSLTLEGHGVFRRNSARFGGVIYLQDIPKITLYKGTELLFEDNQAVEGAAFYISGILRDILCDIDGYKDGSLCFIETQGDYNITFINNVATGGGSIAHLNFLEDIDVLAVNIYEPSFDILTRSPQVGNSVPTIAADPFRLCFCENGIPACDLTSVSRSASRGEEFSVSLAGVTLFNNTIPRSIKSVFLQHGINDSKSLIADTLTITSACSDVNYRVFTTDREEQVVIAAANVCHETSVLVHCLRFNVSIEDCPIGFVVSDNRCTCDSRLSSYSVQCHSATGALTKEANNWIGPLLNATDQSYVGLLLSPNCPFDYCLTPPLDIYLTNADSQCGNNRSGVLCGQCTVNTSISLGDTICRDCSNNAYMLLIIPIALLGIALVVFLFLSGLTVTSGVVNGLILYANIVSANEVSFKVQDTYFLRVFISWVNLDFGFKTCFHNGMTPLMYAAWQFAFPMYLWLVVAFIIILCHYSIRASQFFGKSDPVAVLATLILLSYNKLLSTIVSILTYTYVDYPTSTGSEQQLVWVYDGSIGFFTGWHAVLAVIAILFVVFLFLPYTLVLVTSQILQKSRKISRLFNRLSLNYAINKYQVPYKAESRYWMGLCLLLRGFIQIILVTTLTGNSSGRLLAISTTSLILISIIGGSGGIYSKRWQDVLEISYILNFGFLAVVTYHVNAIGGIQLVATYISTGVAFLTFILVVIIVVIQKLKKKGHMKLPPMMRKKSNSTKTNLLDASESFKTNTAKTFSVTSQEVFLSSFSSDRSTELRESLLDC